jgi:hypothetical protein
MKTHRNTIAALIAAATAVVSGVSEAANRTLILLQENSNGTSYLGEDMGDTTAIDRIIDTAVELGETAKFRAIAAARYQRFVDLSDTRCTRENLLRELIKQSKEGFVTDLAVLGHGDRDLLGLNAGAILVGSPTFSQTLPNRQRDPRHIRNLLLDARLRENNPNFNFKLRLVHMCNCFGGTVNDDWLAIGAKTAVGAPLMDWMPEPMNTFFWDDFTKKDRTVAKAAADSLAATRPFYSVLPDYHVVDPEIGLNRLDETQQLVSGDRNLIFRDEFRMALNESRTFTINAKDANTFVRVFTEPNQRYSFASNTDRWNDGGFLSPSVTAAGHSANIFGPRRISTVNAMSLCAERFTTTNASSFNFIFGSGFKIGMSHSRTFANTGFLTLFANDNIFNDNRGSVKVTIKRIQ